LQNFEFLNPTRIIFGKGAENRVGEFSKEFGRKVLIHYGGGSIKKLGLYDKVIDSLKTANIEVFELGGVKPNPRVSLVREGIKMCRENGIDFILAVGGGSVIDSAKAISAGVGYEGDVWDYFLGKAEMTDTLPIGVVLTIPAAGSETAPGSVITNEEGWLKRTIIYQDLRPKFAILNPELTFTLPAWQTASGAADIMSHVMERYFTNVEHTDFTDRLCEATLKTIIKNAPIALSEPENYDARAEIMWAGTVAHNDLLGTGREGDWASHEIEHELSARYDVTHGAGLAVIFPAWMKYVYKNNINRFAQFAERVWNVEYDINNPERTALEGINRITNFFKELGLPVSFRDLDIPDTHIEDMAALSSRNGTVGNFVKLTKVDVVNIYKLAQ
jgi:alcohol dehydrogenase YqhD (iron-dependent ADH family)